MDFTIPMPEGMAEATPEQWAAYDAKIQAERESAELEAERKRQEDLRKDLVERGCPVKDLERAISGQLEDTKAVVAAQAALDAGQTLLVLSGVRGCGKTTAAAWWLLQKRKPSEYVRVGPPRFVDASTLARWPRYDDARMRELERASALVIDDLGVEYDDKNGAFRSFVDGLVNSRYAACLPTCITTNVPAAEFRQRYGERIADRIRESGRFVELAGESMRKKS